MRGGKYAKRRTPKGMEKPRIEKAQLGTDVKTEEVPGSPQRPLAVWLIPLGLLAVAVAGLIWCMTQYIVVGFHFYPKNRPLLDLRGEKVTAARYEKLAAKLPDCEIYWDVPFQETSYPSDITELTITALSQADVAAMDYFPSLKIVDASQCTDYENLAVLEAHRPEVEVRYQIVLGGQEYHRDAQSIALENVAPEEISRLAGMRELKTVTAKGGDLETVRSLHAYCADRGITFQVGLGGKGIALDASQVQAENVTEGELTLLPLLTQLKELRLVNPQASPEAVEALKTSYPQVDISLELRIGGKTLATGDTEIDLSGVKLKDLEEIEAVMRYLPKAELLFLGVQDGIPNEEMAAFRERSRGNYKVVWEVRIGDTKTLRTDITYFMPGRDWARGPVFGDEIADNLRYCEDLISVDVGHLGSVKTVTWLEGLVNLEYLILAHTDIRSLEGIQACKKLKFLELDWTGIQDLTPLKECTALEDLNIGHAYPDITPLMEMPWLKNVYMIFGNSGDAYKLAQALPDTHVVASGTATVASGWRRLPNYYAMRDALHAYYMN